MLHGKIKILSPFLPPIRRFIAEVECKMTHHESDVTKALPDLAHCFGLCTVDWKRYDRPSTNKAEADVPRFDDGNTDVIRDG